MNDTMISYFHEDTPRSAQNILAGSGGNFLSKSDAELGFLLGQYDAPGELCVNVFENDTTWLSGTECFDFTGTFLSGVGQFYGQMEYHAFEDYRNNPTNVTHLVALNKYEPISITDMIDKIKSVFGLSVVQISNITGVSRPAIYSHLSGVSSVDSSKYEALYKAACKVDDRVHRPLKGGLKSFLIEGKTLLGHLRDLYRRPDEADQKTEEILRVATMVAKKLENGVPKARRLSISDQRRSVAMIGKSG